MYYAARKEEKACTRASKAKAINTRHTQTIMFIQGCYIIPPSEGDTRPRVYQYEIRSPYLLGGRLTLVERRSS